MYDTMRSLVPELTDTQLRQFCTYYEMLADWNTRVNLTAVTEKTDVAKKHFLDSLAAAPLLKTGARVIDVGTGAGFPGVPLLILRPDLQLTLLDAQQKRIAFLDALLPSLGLSARTLHARAEDAGRDDALRGHFDAALSRAVAQLSVLLECCVPLLKVGGLCIAYKGDAAAEFAASAHAAELLCCKLTLREVPADYGARTLAVAEKRAKTPPAYPRRAGLPAKKPL